VSDGFKAKMRHVWDRQQHDEVLYVPGHRKGCGYIWTPTGCVSGSRTLEKLARAILADLPAPAPKRRKKR
jgi:hypothetical protein